jgi:hypothetical protein
MIRALNAFTLPLRWRPVPALVAWNSSGSTIAVAGQESS